MIDDKHTSGSTSQPQEQQRRAPEPQTALLLCSSHRLLLNALMDEVKQRLEASATTILLYGATMKRQEGFIVVEAALGIPGSCLRWFREDQRIFDFIVYDIPSFAQERAAQEEAQVAQIAQVAQALLAWAEQHQMQIVPDDEREGLKLIPKEDEEASERSSTSSSERQQPPEQEKGEEQP
jgi:hypothetical protein